jgi:hypothetical protein
MLSILVAWDGGYVGQSVAYLFCLFSFLAVKIKIGENQQETKEKIFSTV